MTEAPRARALCWTMAAAVLLVAFAACDLTAPAVSTPRLGVGTVDRSYSAPLQATGAAAPYSWSATGLPAGLAVKGAQIAGTPTKAGTFGVTVRARGKGGATATRAYNLVVMTAAQQEALDHLNEKRSGLGRSRLGTNTEEMLKAQRWAAHLASIGSLAHTTLSDGQPSCMRVAGENVGWNSTADAVIDAWMKSQVHFANINNAQFTRVGIGIAVANGKLYIVAEFLGGC